MARPGSMHFVTGKTLGILSKTVGYWLPVIGHPAQAKFLSYKKLVLQVFGLTTKKAESCYIVIFCNIIRIRDSTIFWTSLCTLVQMASAVAVWGARTDKI